MSDASLRVASAAMLTSWGQVYQGLLREHSPTGREVWRCDHEHPARPGARACARGELAQRTIPEPPPEMRGTWPHHEHCPMCARGLMHTQREHQQLDPHSRNHQGAAT